MPRHRKKQQGPQNLDSLVDIVSNNVGMLVILAAFMALFGLFNGVKADRKETTQRPPAKKKLQVPWSHSTNKNPVLFTIKGNRVFHLDMRTFYQNLSKTKTPTNPEPVVLEQPLLRVRFFPVTNQIFCMEFFPLKGAGETWLQATQPVSDWKKVMDTYDPNSFFYFFWVAGDSFELFRDVREVASKSQYEVGWKPIVKEGPLELCNGFEGSAAFQPQ